MRLVLTYDFLKIARTRYMSSILVPTIENGKELCIRVFSFSCFLKKSGAINNRQNGSSDISYKSPFSRDSNDV